MKNTHLIPPLIALLLATACATVQRQSSQTMTIDSASTIRGTIRREDFDSITTQMQRYSNNRTGQAQTLLIEEEGIPERTATLTIPLQSLHELPEGAKYTTHEGWASVEAERRGTQIVLRGRADSIARHRLYYEHLNTQQHTIADSLSQLRTSARTDRSQFDSLLLTHSQATKSAEVVRKAPVTWHWWLLIGFAVGAACTACLTRLNPLKSYFNR